MEQPKPNFWQRLKKFAIGEARSPWDQTLFQKISLVALLAWVGVGADGLSSACYGPEEAFRALGEHRYLGIFVALATAITVLVISASYTQIIEAFPAGGGGYLVASKLLSPWFGMVSGCALLVDYALTIAVSISSGADALFSLLPESLYRLRLWVAVVGVIILVILNLRGVRESVLSLMPIFFVFVVTHLVLIACGIGSHLRDLPDQITNTLQDVDRSINNPEIGFLGMAFIVLRAYSMGAGTYTGIEAVSNSLPILREPKVETARQTMRYMAISLAVIVMGVMIGYLVYGVSPRPGKTMNAVLVEAVAANWGSFGYVFVVVTLLSEALLLYVAAQTGMVGGPRVLANMAVDNWAPSRFRALSDRFVTQNGIVYLGGAALVLMILTGGSVQILVILYSINVFITFVLSQLGMVRHWWLNRTSVPGWGGKLLINGIGLVLTLFILISVTVAKFHEGGFLTLLVTGGLIVGVVFIRRHYEHTAQMLRRLDTLTEVAKPTAPAANSPPPAFDPHAKTAVVLVNGFNGLGLHTLFTLIRMFGGLFKNFVFVQVGVIDVGNFKGRAEIERLENHTRAEVNRYVEFMRSNGYYAEGFSSIGTDVVDAVAELAPKIIEKYPHAIFFGGQLVFPHDTLLTRWLHNYVVFAMQRRFYNQGTPFVILPIRV